MTDSKQTSRKAASSYRVRSIFPGKAFTKTEQQRIAAQISTQLNLRKNTKCPTI